MTIAFETSGTLKRPRTIQMVGGRRAESGERTTDLRPALDPRLAGSRPQGASKEMRQRCKSKRRTSLRIVAVSKETAAGTRKIGLNSRWGAHLVVTTVGERTAPHPAPLPI